MRTKKKLLALVLVLAMVLTLFPVTALAAGEGEGEGSDVGGEDTTYVAQIEDKQYETLADAISAAENGDTVELLEDVTLTSGITVNKAITLDLGSNTVSISADASAISVGSGGDLEITGSGTISATGNGRPLQVIGNTNANTWDNTNTTATLTIDSDVTVTSSATYDNCVYIAGKGAVLNVYGTLKGTNKCAAIQGNGTNNATTNNGGTEINIFDGASVTSDAVAMYIPQAGVVNIYGGTVEGYAGIGIKSGTLNITGGTVRGTANDNELSDQHSATNGIAYDGSAIVIDSYIGYAGAMDLNISDDAEIESMYSTAIREIGNDAGATNVVSIAISGGTIKAASGKDCVMVRDVTKNTVVITGGTFTSDPSDYVAKGYVCNLNGDTYIVEPLGEENAAVKVTGSGGTSYYLTLADAINAVEDGDTVTLLADVTEDVVIPEGANITLDLGTYTLTNKSSHTIVNNGTLTITGDGTVDNVTHAKAAIYNNGTMILESGTYTRSKENGQSADDNGGNSYYTVLNHGTMTVESGVVVENNGKYSSMFENGWQDGSQNTSKTPSTLTINGGTFNGGLNTIKNDDYGELEINDGTFTNFTQSCFLNWNVATVNGGTFDGTNASAAVILNGFLDATMDQGNLTVTDGTYIGKYVLAQMGGSSYIGTVSIEGGTFESSVSVVSGSPVIGNGSLTITGGTFTSDPSDYVATGYTVLEEDGTYRVGVPVTVTFESDGGSAVESQTLLSGDKATAPADPTQDGYAFLGWYTEDGELYDFDTPVTSDITLTARWNEVAPAEPPEGVEEIQIANGETVTAVDPALSDSETATEIAEALSGSDAVTEEGLSDAAAVVAADSKVINDAVVAEAQEKLDTTEPVTIVVETYLDITVTAVDSDEDDTIQSFTLDITPMYQLKATDGETTVTIGSAQELTVTNSVTLTIPLPSGFAGDSDTLYVHHEKNGVTYVYTGTVKSDTLTFTNPHGFSEFTITSEAPAASIGEIGYTSLQDAVDAVGYKKTIVVYRDGLKAEVSGNTTFYIELGEGVTEYPTLTAADGYVLTDNGKGTYTVYERSSGGTVAVTYDIDVEQPDNGSIEIWPEKAAAMSTVVTVTVTPDRGYVLDELIVTDSKGNELELTDKGNGKYTFVMPASDVTVEAYFEEEAETVVIGQPPFTDVSSGAWYYDAVAYVYAYGLMQGTSATTFEPEINLSRAMLAQVLYNMESGSAVITTQNTFTDVSSSAWYAAAVNWAAAAQIVNGYGDGTFGPEDNITREQLAAILYRYAKYKGYDTTQGGMAIREYSDYESISSYATDAMTWAVNVGVITGTDAGTLNPLGTATRAEVAQMLMNFCENVVR